MPLLDSIVSKIKIKNTQGFHKRSKYRPQNFSQAEAKLKAPQTDRLDLSFVKDFHVVGEKMAEVLENIYVANFAQQSLLFNKNAT